MAAASAFFLKVVFRWASGRWILSALASPVTEFQDRPYLIASMVPLETPYASPISLALKGVSLSRSQIWSGP